MSNPTVPCMSHFTTAKGEHWCSVEVDLEHAARAYSDGKTVAHEGPCVEISATLGTATEDTVWAAMESNAHLIAPAIFPLCQDNDRCPGVHGHTGRCEVLIVGRGELVEIGTALGLSRSALLSDTADLRELVIKAETARC